MFQASMSSWALAQTFRLGARMTSELEWLYETINGHTKNLLALQRYATNIPKNLKPDLDKAITDYESHLEGRLMSKEDKAMLKFFWDYFMGDQK
jgi:hypothetical protein